MASASAIEVRIGRGDPSAMSLNPGTVLDPTSIGKTGMWRVEGPGVLDVHGYIYYDGKALYVQSADDKSPLMVNKHRVSTAWTEVKPGSTIEVGRAELFYRAGAASADADATVARPMTGMPGQEDDPDSTKPKRPSNPTMMDAQGPKPGAPLFRPGAGAFVNRADDESTRLRPMDEGNAAPAGGIRPAAGAPMARPNIGRPMMDAQESTVIAPIEELSGNRAPTGPRPGMTGPAMGQPMGMGAGMAPGMGGPAMMGSPMGMPGQMGGPQMMGQPGMQGRPGMPGQMGMPGQPMGMPGQPMGMPGQQQMGMPGQPWGMPGGNPANPTMTQPAVPTDALGKFKADWATYPPTKKAIFTLCPFIMVAAFVFLIFDDGSPAAGAANPAASGSAATSAHAVSAASAATQNTGSAMQGSAMQGAGMQGSELGLQGGGVQGATTQQGPSAFGTTPTATASSIFGDPTPTASASASAAPTSKTPPPNTKPPVAAAGDKVDAGALDPAMGVEPKTRTNERKAADAWAEGNYELAAQMYDELARQQPGNPAFSTAASILRQKLDGGVR